MSHRLSRQAATTWGRDYKRVPHFPKTLDQVDDKAEAFAISLEWLIVAALVLLLAGICIGDNQNERYHERVEQTAQDVPA